MEGIVMKRWLILSGVALVLLLVMALGPKKFVQVPKEKDCSQARSAYALFQCDPERANLGYERLQEEKRLGEIKIRIQALEEERDRLAR